MVRDISVCDSRVHVGPISRSSVTDTRSATSAQHSSANAVRLSQNLKPKL